MPTKAIWEGKECDVRVDSDLEANWSVSILSGEYDPVSLIRRPAAPLMIKLRAKTRWLAMDAGLSIHRMQLVVTSRSYDPDHRFRSRAGSGRHRRPVAAHGGAPRGRGGGRRPRRNPQSDESVRAGAPRPLSGKREDRSGGRRD